MTSLVQSELTGNMIMLDQTEPKKRASPLTAKQLMKIYNVLEERLQPDPSSRPDASPKLVEYKDKNHTDQSIADEFGVSMYSVRKLRQENFGHFRRLAPPSPKQKDKAAATVYEVEGLFENMAALEKRVADQTEKISDLKKTIDENWASWVSQNKGLNLVFKSMNQSMQTMREDLDKVVGSVERLDKQIQSVNYLDIARLKIAMDNLIEHWGLNPHAVFLKKK